MAETLNTKIVKGVSWSLIETFVAYFIRFFIGILLARILMPSDFGMIGMITIFIAISDVFVKAGFGQAFIRKKDTTDIDANTVFFINLSISVAIYIILFFAAPYIASYFHEPGLVKLIRVLCLVIIVNSFNVIQHSIIRKEMQFKRKAILTVSSSLVGGVVGVLCAYKGLGVWSLVIQQLTNKIVLCILFYSTSEWRPSFKFSGEVAKKMFSYGSWLLGADLLLTIMNNFYKIFIGRYHSSQELGYYERSRQFQAMVADTFSWVFGIVAFPSFTKVQDSYSAMLDMAKKFVMYSAYLIYPILCIILVVSEPMIHLLLTDKWLPAVPYLKILCLVGMVVPLNFFLSPYLQAAGYSKLVFLSTVFTAVLRVLNVILTFSYGVKALLIGEIFVLLLNLLVFSLLSDKKMKGNNYLKTLPGLWACFVATGAIFGLGYLIRHIMLSSAEWLQLVATATAMGAAYIILLFLLDRKNLKTLIQYLVRII